MVNRCILILTALVLTCSCRQIPPYDPGQTEVIDTVRIIMNNCFADIRMKGAEAELDYLDASKDFFWVPPGYDRALPYDSVVAIIKMNGNSIRSRDNRWDSLKIVPLSAETAVYTGKYSSELTDTGGSHKKMSFMETGTLVRRSSGWKILCGQTAAITGK